MLAVEASGGTDLRAYLAVIRAAIEEGAANGSTAVPSNKGLKPLVGKAGSRLRPISKKVGILRTPSRPIPTGGRSDKDLAANLDTVFSKAFRLMEGN